MLILKIIGKILLLPVWILLAVCGLLVHIIVGIFNIFRGFWTVFFSILTLIALCFGMWQNALFFIIAIAAAFILLLVGSFIDLLLEEIRRCIGRFILM